MTGAAFSAALALTPVCASCTRRLARQAVPQWSPSFVQVRGKKKTPNRRTSLAVRLLQDLPEYGRKGSIVPVPIGQMRNALYPRQIAAYIPMEEMRMLRRNNTPIERDPTFGREGYERAESSSAAPEYVTPKVDLKRLAPEGAFNLLSDVIPPTLDFYRRPIGSREDRSTPRQTHSAAHEAQSVAPPPGTSPRQDPDNIFGSVSIADINTAIRALLLQRGLIGLVVLPDEDIKFVNISGADVEADRVKKLGEYEFEVRIKGHEEIIQRFIRVLPEEEMVSANQETPSANMGVSIDPSAPGLAQKVVDAA